jgi:hypothetical protein
MSSEPLWWKRKIQLSRPGYFNFSKNGIQSKLYFSGSLKAEYHSIFVKINSKGVENTSVDIEENE